MVYTILEYNKLTGILFTHLELYFLLISSSTQTLSNNRSVYKIDHIKLYNALNTHHILFHSLLHYAELPQHLPIYCENKNHKLDT